MGGLNVQTSDAIINTFFTAADDDASGDNPVGQMMKHWNNTGTYTFFQVPSSTIANVEHTDVSNYINDGEMGIYLHSTWFPNISSSALAITQYSGVRRQVGWPTEWVELTHADIIVNSLSYTFSTDPLSTVDYDITSVILHELGHFIGLPHQMSGAPSVMSPFLSLLDSSRNPLSADISSLQSLYNLIPLQRQLKAHNLKILNSSGSQPGEGEYVLGIIELRSDGQCLHYENNKLVQQHQVGHSFKVKKN